MNSLSVDPILAAVVVAVFLIALYGRKIIGSGGRKTDMGPLAEFFNWFWGWADYTPKDWSNAPYKRGYDLGHGH
jgi:hypothetical protein